jgi:2-hydroxymuconate-semialdehyde hydrolase
MRALNWILLVPLLLASGCLSFQQGPTTRWGTDNFVQINDKEKLYVLDSGGDKPAVLLIHGFGASHTSWVGIRPSLQKHYRVIAVDLPGHGFSDKYEGDYSIKAVAARLLRLLDLKGIKRAHVLGHSWGTAVSLSLAIQAPERVRSLTLMAAFAYEKQVAPFLIWARAPVMGEFLFSQVWDQRLDDRLAYAFYDADKFATPEVTEKAKAVMKRPGVLAAALAAARGIRFTEMEPHYPELNVPVLILSGREDRVTRLAPARQLNADLPDSRHKVIPLCGHLIPVEHPKKVLRLIKRFWAELEPAAKPVSAPACVTATGNTSVTATGNTEAAK